MPLSRTPVAHLGLHYRRDDFLSLLEESLPRIWSHAESLALYLLVAAFWGFVAYAALTYAVQ